MGRKERKEQEESLLNYNVEEDVQKKEKELETYEKIRCVLFFICIVILIISLILTKWVFAILSVVAIIISIPFKYIIKIFPNNLKLYDFLYPKYYPSEHRIELIENDDINSKNIIKRNKAKKQILKNRREAKEAISNIYSNISLIKMFSVYLVGLFILSSLLMFVPGAEVNETKDATTSANVSSTINPNVVKPSTTIATAYTTTTTTTTTTTEPTTLKEIKFYVEEDDENIYLEVDDFKTVYLYQYGDADIASDLTIKPVVKNKNIVKIEEDSDNYDGEYCFIITAKKAGSTTISFKSNKDNYTFDKIKVEVENPESTTKDNSRTVYVTPSGECYHFIESCGGKNSYPITLNEAKSRGYRHCSKCAG